MAAQVAGNCYLPGGQLLNPASPEYQFLLGYGCSTVFNPFFSGKSTSQSLSEGNVSGTVKLSYRFNEDVMAYVSWANGYKAGGFNLARVTSAHGAGGSVDAELRYRIPARNRPVL